MTRSNSRRQILGCLGGIVAAGLAEPATASLIAPTSTLAAPRALTFDNLHTGEKASVEYWAQGKYLPDALHEVNFILRDYRNGEVHPIEPKLLDLLHRLHAKLESSQPFEVISGYRSPQTNAMLRASGHGAASKSYHMKGMAIDIRLGDKGLKDIHEAALLLRAGGVGYYPESDFVHIDVGPVRRW
ncbi:MAG: DUF882 domain-containing protein [Rhizomicrobium sp.]